MGDQHAELSLLVLQLNLSLCLGGVHDLWLAVGRSKLKAELLNRPGRASSAAVAPYNMRLTPQGTDVAAHRGHLFRYLQLHPRKEKMEHNLLASLESSFDDLRLGTRGDTGNLFEFDGRVLSPLYAVHEAEAQPTDLTLLIYGAVDPVNDDRVVGQLPHILPLKLL